MSKAIRIIAAALSGLTFMLCVSCASMGDYDSTITTDSNGANIEDYEEYYALFDGGEGTFITEDPDECTTGSEDYSVEESLFNSYTVNNMKTEDSSDMADYDSYLYFSLKLTKDVYLDDFGFFVLPLSPDSALSLDMYFFILSDEEYNNMTKLRTYNELLYEQEEDDEGEKKFDEYGKPVYKKDGDGNYIEIGYDDPDITSAVASYSLSLKDTYNSVYIDDWGSSQKNRIPVNKDDHFLIYFRSNSGYGKDEGKQLTSFSIINVMMCVYNSL